jgi:hemoglobin
VSDPTLYEQLGGKDALEAAVDLFYEKVLADDRIKHFFDGVDMGKQRGKQKIFLAYAFGGPVSYSGKDMRDAHKHLDLTEEHFAAVAGNLQATLQEMGVAEDLVEAVMAIAASTHDDVLNL